MNRQFYSAVILIVCCLNVARATLLLPESEELVGRYRQQMEQQIQQARDANWIVHGRLYRGETVENVPHSMVIARPRVMTEYAPPEDAGVVSARYTLFDLLILEENTPQGWQVTKPAHDSGVVIDRWVFFDNKVRPQEGEPTFYSRACPLSEYRPLVSIGYFELLEDAHTAPPKGPLVLHQLMIYPPFRSAGLGCKAMQAVQQTAKLHLRPGVECLYLQALQPDLEAELLVYPGTARWKFYQSALQMAAANFTAPHRLSFYEKCGFELCPTSINHLNYLDNTFFIRSLTTDSLKRYIQDYGLGQVEERSLQRVLNELRGLTSVTLASPLMLWSMAKGDADAAAQRILDRAYYDTELTEEEYNNYILENLFIMVWSLNQVPGEKRLVTPSLPDFAFDPHADQMIQDQIREWLTPRKRMTRQHYAKHMGRQTVGTPDSDQGKIPCEDDMQVD
ncbi:MAG: hypothetical protein ACK5O7_02100 [Holosporales bacterium]